MDRCGPVWTGVDRCGPVWTGVDRCGPVWTGVDRCGPVWTGVDRCGPVWTGVDRCGPVLTGVDHLAAKRSLRSDRTSNGREFNGPHAKCINLEYSGASAEQLEVGWPRTAYAYHWGFLYSFMYDSGGEPFCVRGPNTFLENMFLNNT